MENHCLWDEYGTRYTLIKSAPGDKLYNWLFILGGPGADAIVPFDLFKGD